MNFKLFGGTLSALLLAAALTGCSPSTSGTSGGTAGAGSPDATLATVGSSSVTRAQLSQTLEGIYGEQILPELIDTQLLTEALKAKKGEVTDAEVDAELARIEEQTPSVKKTIEAGGARVDVIRNQIRRNLTVQKLLTDGIPADQAKEKAFFTKFSSYYGTPVQVRVGLLAASTKVRADQLERALKAKPDSFAALVAEQKASKDQLAARLSNADLGQFEAPSEFGPAEFAPLGVPPQALAQIAPALAPITKALATAKKGQILPAQGISAKGPFLIVKVVDRKEATKPDFAKVQPSVETDYKMAQKAEIEIKKNPGNPQSLDQVVKQVITYLAQPNPQTGQPGVKAGLRDALTTILQPASNNLLQSLRTAGTVQVSDPAYKEVAKGYQSLTAAEGASANSAAGNSAAGNTAAATTTNSGTTTTNSAAPAKP